ncbi:MAG: aminotransferase class V-fold PLP-dependent enzyme [SAR202 cluster bacterium]|nr:aminotransferase class V-fold PLP-dependent enzyme [SAR202 cluster bacterium]
MAIPSIDQIKQDPYASLGVRKFINATCHHTIIGGTLIPEVSLDAMRSAAAFHVDMMELERAAGRVIAHYTHAEDGYVTSGCAAAMLVGTAAILTGTDIARMYRLPDTTGMKSLCIAKRFPRKKSPEGVEYADPGYAMAVQTAGVKFVEVGDGSVVTRAQYEAAFSDEVALVYWVGYGPKGDLPVKEVISIAHAHHVPVLIDCSNYLPPKESLYRFIDQGADLVCFSGGKGIQGPQGSGILAGRADLIKAVSMQTAPEHGIGRVCKVSKEEIVGLISSLMWWAEQDDEERMLEQHGKARRLADLARAIPGASTEVADFDSSQRPFPTVHFKAPAARKMNAQALLTELRAGDPPIAAMNHPSDPMAIRLDVRLCSDQEIEAIARRLAEIAR